jgi:hypothetical protein
LARIRTFRELWLRDSRFGSGLTFIVATKTGIGKQEKTAPESSFEKIVAGSHPNSP